MQALEAYVQHLMDDWIDVIVLLLLQFLNVFLGFFEELKARRRPADAPRAPPHSLLPGWQRDCGAQGPAQAGGDCQAWQQGV